MKRAYSINPDGTSVPLKNILCTNEESELQDILEKNLQMIPGDQINPEDPCRWICVKRELPIEDPSNGENRWSLDFLLVDQSGIPTFVECKRFLDTRSRREVIGQMFDYAANGSYYCSRNKIFDYLQEEAQRKNADLETLLLEIDPVSGESIDSFLDLIENNLREGQVRLVFFMEESPYELKSIVEFLNNQLERTEVIIVEAQQFMKDNLRIVTPMVWGYTEKARRVKKSTVTTTGNSTRQKWNYDKFMRTLSEKFSEERMHQIITFYDNIKKMEKFKVRWGTGKVDGSFSLIAEEVCPRSFFNAYTNGSISFPLLWLNEGEAQIELRNCIFRFLVDTGFDLSEKQNSDWITIRDWTSRIDSIETLLRLIAEKYCS